MYPLIHQAQRHLSASIPDPSSAVFTWGTEGEMDVQKDGLWQYSFGGLPFSRDILSDISEVSPSVKCRGQCCRIWAHLSVLLLLWLNLLVTSLPTWVVEYRICSQLFTQYSLPVCPASSWDPRGSLPLLQGHFSRMAWKTSLEFWLHGGEIPSCSHPSLLFCHPSTHTLHAGLSWRITSLKQAGFACKAELDWDFWHQIKHMITLFTISLWHPLILESPWVRLCLVQGAQKVRDEEHKAKCHQCSKCFWPAGTKKVFAVVFLVFF